MIICDLNKTMKKITIQEIKKTNQLISQYIIKTPLKKSLTLSQIFNCEIFLKLENYHFTASFKERGALNKILSLNQKEKKGGVVAISAGNHAQAVAYHSTRLGIQSTIFMPENTPFIKVKNTETLGGKVQLFGQNVSDTYKEAKKFQHQHDLTLIHPYDDEKIIIGQGTAGLEILQEISDLEILIVPIGGGGLISGISIVAKNINPKIKVYGVQSKLYPTLYQILKKTNLPIGGSTIAEGIAVKAPGEITKEIIEKYVDDIFLVSEVEIEQAICMLLDIEKTVVEGAGAAALATIISRPDFFQNKKIGVLVCGGNIDQRILSSVLLRNLVYQGRLARLKVKIIDQPGSLSKISNIIGNNGGNIIEVFHQRIFSQISVKDSVLETIIETKDKTEISKIIKELEKNSFPTSLVEVTEEPNLIN